MSGKYKGAQAIILKEQPLAPYVHCRAHCVNLITQQACSASAVIKNAIDWVNELGVLFSHSGKMKDAFKAIAKAEDGPVSIGSFASPPATLSCGVPQGSS